MTETRIAKKPRRQRAPQIMAGKTKLRKILMYEGIPVIDATEDLIFTATEEDRLKAIPGDDRNCVHACALMRETGAPEVEVGKSRTLVMAKDRSHWVRYRTSMPMRQQFIAGDQTKNEHFQLDQYVVKAFSASKLLGSGTQGSKTRPKDPDHVAEKRVSTRFKHNGVRHDAKRLEAIYVPA